MKLTDPQFNRMLEIFQEFGPRRRIPVYERWGEAFPEASHEDRREWEDLCRGIEDFAYKLAERVIDRQLDRDVAIRQIAERFPRLNRDRVGHTYSQAMYFAMK